MGKRQIRSQEKHSEGRKIPYRSELLEGQDESSGLFAWESRRQGDDSDCFFAILLQGGIFSLRKRGIHESTSSSEMRSPGYCVSLPIVSSPFGRFII